MKKSLGVLIVVIILAAAVFLLVRESFDQGLLGEASASYKAVTLANNTVYFGHITKSDSATVTLTDVFYLRTATVPADSKTPAAQGQLELAKPSNELLGPADQMVLNRRYILSIQELKPDSKVVAAISAYYKGGTGTPTPTLTPAKTGKVDVRGQ